MFAKGMSKILSNGIEKGERVVAANRVVVMLTTSPRFQ